MAFLLLSASGIAVAAPDGKARDHYERALAFARLEDRRSAIREFEESFRWSAEPDILYNIALTYRELGEGAPGGTPQDLMLAVEYYERYLAALPHAKERAKIRAWIATVRSKATEQSAAPARGVKTSDSTALATAVEPPRSTVPPHAVPAPVGLEHTAAPASHRLSAEPAPVGPTKSLATPADTHKAPRYKFLEGMLGGTIAVSLAGVAAGVGILYSDDRVPCTPVPPSTQCAVVYHYDTKSSGIALIASGGAIAAGAAALLLYVELQRHRTRLPVALAPWSGDGARFGVLAAGAF